MSGQHLYLAPWDFDCCAEVRAHQAFLETISSKTSIETWQGSYSERRICKSCNLECRFLETWDVEITTLGQHSPFLRGNDPNGLINFHWSVQQFGVTLTRFLDRPRHKLSVPPTSSIPLFQRELAEKFSFLSSTFLRKLSVTWKTTLNFTACLLSAVNFHTPYWRDLPPSYPSRLSTWRLPFSCKFEGK